MKGIDADWSSRSGNQRAHSQDLALPQKTLVLWDSVHALWPLFKKQKNIVVFRYHVYAGMFHIGGFASHESKPGVQPWRAVNIACSLLTTIDEDPSPESRVLSQNSFPCHLLPGNAFCGGYTTHSAFMVAQHISYLAANSF